MEGLLSPQLPVLSASVGRDGATPLDLSALELHSLLRYVRVLVAVPNPGKLNEYGLSAIDPDAEFKLLQDAVAGNRNIELVKLDKSKPARNIQQRLEAETDHHSVSSTSRSTDIE